MPGPCARRGAIGAVAGRIAVVVVPVIPVIEWPVAPITITGPPAATDDDALAELARKRPGMHATHTGVSATDAGVSTTNTGVGARQASSIASDATTSRTTFSHTVTAAPSSGIASSDTAT